MEKLLPHILLTLFICSCNPEAEITPPEFEQFSTCKLEIYVHECPTIHCEQELPLEEFQIELYRTQQNAMDGTDLLSTGKTNEEGIVSFPVLDCQTLFIKINTEDFGTYIGSENLAINSSNNFHNVRFIDGFVYNENDSSSLKQETISLIQPQVGQQSTYRYHQNHQHISYTPLEYTDLELKVTIVDQLDANSFLVTEEIDSFEIMISFWSYPETSIVKNIWTISEDSLHIQSPDMGPTQSFIWHLNEEKYTAEESGSFSLIRPSENRIDMTTDDQELYDWSWSGTGFAEDYNLFGHLFDNLIVNHMGYTGTDGPLKLRFYNQEHGLVRSFDIFRVVDCRRLGLIWC